MHSKCNSTSLQSCIRENNVKKACCAFHCIYWSHRAGKQILVAWGTREKGWMPHKSMRQFHVGHIQQLFSLAVSTWASKEDSKASVRALPASIALSLGDHEATCPAEKTGRESLFTRPSCPPTTQSNWAKLNWARKQRAIPAFKCPNTIAIPAVIIVAK